MKFDQFSRRLLFSLSVVLVSGESLVASTQEQSPGVSASYVSPSPEMAPDSFLRSRPLDSSMAPPLQGHAGDRHYGIEMPWGEKRFESFRSAYLSEGGKKWLLAIMARATPYRSYISERLVYYGLPDELAFLPAIESEFSSRAVSKSGAAGLWQFMKNSIGGYNIRIDDWVDDRRDFMKSTDAALKKLADNYAYFQDWPLALAAYNAGLGAISRLVTRTGIKDFWELSRRGLLPRETTSYVPKFLAVASLLSYPGRIGLPNDWAPAAEWETVELNRSVDLSVLAETLDLGLSELKSVNAELRYTVTPPYAGYRLKVPAGSGEAVRALLADPSQKLIRYHLHKVHSGDTLSAISRDYGTPQSMILQANPGLKPNILKLGQILVIPALKEGLPTVKIEAKGENVSFTGSYIVQKGDSLWGIALRYDVQPEVLAEKNGLELTSVIREGMRLSVPILKP